MMDTTKIRLKYADVFGNVRRDLTVKELAQLHEEIQAEPVTDADDEKARRGALLAEAMARHSHMKGKPVSGQHLCASHDMLRHDVQVAVTEIGKHFKLLRKRIEALEKQQGATNG